MHERIKLLRKALGYNQSDFGKLIGVKQPSIAAYENGTRIPLDAVIFSICKEFGVNESWLRDGTGEMFEEMLPEDEYAAAAAEIAKDDPLIRQIITIYGRQPEASKEAIRQYIREVAEEVYGNEAKKEETSEDA